MHYWKFHRISNTSIWKDLKENDFGGSLSGDKFSTRHGDLIIEMTVNREVKVRVRPVQGGYSTDFDAMNMKLRSVLKERIRLLTFLKHKETTLGARKKHETMIKRLVTKLEEVLDPFSSGPAKYIKSGVLLDDLIGKGLLKSDEIGEKHLQDFI